VDLRQTGGPIRSTSDGRTGGRGADRALVTARKFSGGPFRTASSCRNCGFALAGLYGDPVRAPEFTGPQLVPLCASASDRRMPALARKFSMKNSATQGQQAMGQGLEEDYCGSSRAGVRHLAAKLAKHQWTNHGRSVDKSPIWECLHPRGFQIRKLISPWACTVPDQRSAIRSSVHRAHRTDNFWRQRRYAPLPGPHDHPGSTPTFCFSRTLLKKSRHVIVRMASRENPPPPP